MSRSTAPTATEVLDRALGARKVAIFGASEKPGTFGNVLAAEFLRQGFAGEVVLFNPRGGQIGEHRITTNLTEAAGADLALIASPTRTVVELVAACGELEIPLAVVSTDGFRESGDVSLERELLATARRCDVRILGPNTVGPDVPGNRLLLGLNPLVPPGYISVASQSGGVPQYVSRRISQLGLGYDAIVTLGNKLDLGFADLLDLFSARRQTRSVLLYMEDCAEGEGLFVAVEQAAATKPVVALIGGRTQAGAVATRSHTGSMLSRADRLGGMLAECGALPVDSLREACAALEAGGLAVQPRLEARRAFVLTDGGGASVLCSDALSDAGFDLPQPSASLTAALAEIVDRPGTNPLDLAGAAHGNTSVFPRLLEAIDRSGEYDGLLLGVEFGAYAEFDEAWAQQESDAINGVIALAGRVAMPVVVWSMMAGNPAVEANARLRKAGIGCGEWPEDAAATLASAFRRSRVAADQAQPAAAGPEPGWEKELCEATERAIAALDAAGVPQSIGPLVERGQLEEAQGGRWVLRLDGFAHKNRVGAIKVGVEDDQLLAAYDELAAIARDHDADELIRVGELFDHEHELIVTFWGGGPEGSGCAIGAGGVNTEEHQDLAIGRIPRDEDDVRRILGRSRAGRRVLLDRSHADAATSAILGLARVFEESIPFAELECNPLAVGAAGASVLDLLPTGLEGGWER